MARRKRKRKTGSTAHPPVDSMPGSTEDRSVDLLRLPGESISGRTEHDSLKAPPFRVELSSGLIEPEVSDEVSRRIDEVVDALWDYVDDSELANVGAPLTTGYLDLSSMGLTE